MGLKCDRGHIFFLPSYQPYSRISGLTGIMAAEETRKTPLTIGNGLPQYYRRLLSLCQRGTDAATHVRRQDHLSWFGQVREQRRRTTRSIAFGRWLAKNLSNTTPQTSKLDRRTRAATGTNMDKPTRTPDCKIWKPIYSRKKKTRVPVASIKKRAWPQSAFRVTPRINTDESWYQTGSVIGSRRTEKIIKPNTSKCEPATNANSASVTGNRCHLRIIFLWPHLEYHQDRKHLWKRLSWNDRDE